MNNNEDVGFLGWRIIFGQLHYGLSPEITAEWSRVHILLAALLGFLLAIS